MAEPSTRHLNGLTFEHVNPSKSILYHEHALSFVTNSLVSQYKGPTQLAYPNGQISLGFAQTNPQWSVLSIRPQSNDSEEARQSFLQNSRFAIYASVAESNLATVHLTRKYQILLSACVLLQTFLLLRQFSKIRDIGVIYGCLYSAELLLYAILVLAVVFKIIVVIDIFNVVQNEMILLFAFLAFESKDHWYIIALIMFTLRYSIKLYDIMSPHVIFLKPQND